MPATAASANATTSFFINFPPKVFMRPPGLARIRAYQPPPLLRMSRFCRMRVGLDARLRAQDLLIFPQHSHGRFGDLCGVAFANFDHEANVPIQPARSARLFVRRQVGKRGEIPPSDVISGSGYVGERTAVLRGHGTPLPSDKRVGATMVPGQPG